jgi:hypothetical protein
MGCPEVHAVWQLVAEVVGNEVARQMGIVTAPPCVVEVSEATASAVNRSLREQDLDFRISAGFAAGCDFIPGLSPWTLDQPVGERLQHQAGQLFTFDQLSQNPDRRREKVNCALTNNGLLAFDFELCFSHCFLVLIGQAPAPAWKPSNANLAKSHLFYTEVKSKPPTEAMIRDWARSLSREWWTGVRAGLPEPWHDAADVIGEHLREVHTHADAFAKDIVNRCLL